MHNTINHVLRYCLLLTQCTMNATCCFSRSLTCKNVDWVEFEKARSALQFSAVPTLCCTYNQVFFSVSVLRRHYMQLSSLQFPHCVVPKTYYNSTPGCFGSHFKVIAQHWFQQFIIEKNMTTTELNSTHTLLDNKLWSGFYQEIVPKI